MNTFNIKLINLFVISLFAIPAGCDEAEIQNQDSEVVDAEDDANAADDVDPNVAPEDSVNEFELDAPEEAEMAGDIDWSEFDLTSQPAAGPAGKTCCVNCGDNWAGLWDLGTADNCNSRGATFCHSNGPAGGWSFINAEWLTHC